MDKVRPRVCHIRFYKNQPLVGKNNQKYDRVVTCAWRLDTEKMVLKYGATVWQKNYKGDMWIKSPHRWEALGRYEISPIKVSIYGLNPVDFISSFALDNYIARKLIFQYGCYRREKTFAERLFRYFCKEEKKADKVLDFEFLNIDWFNKRYDPRFDEFYGGSK